LYYAEPGFSLGLSVLMIKEQNGFSIWFWLILHW